ncbi:hypothetical protein M7I_7888 [Glarea lozoyensis 74030]|uniref:Uncharacterized protein n=1 Tax=Glarea lozoyensis (strain ATCC 74030 / MF5533) TaxID=1104152 RepID=H0EYI6_GLAL7|nr:hypothetical protein M7I_7888 [Glarea lozoyensis 74030]
MSSEPFSTVLSLPRPDHPANEANFVLLHVESTGRRQLDLKLIGTEEETVFSVAFEANHGLSKAFEDIGSQVDEFARMEEKDAQIKKLEEGMDELVKLKTSHESALLEKFSILLNEKKLKIRDQQRLLSASNIDPEKLEEVARSRDSRSRSAGPSRSGKRKLAVKDDESDDGFEKMEVEEEADVLNDSDGEGRRTPEPDLTASEDSDDEPVPPPIRKTAHSQEMNEPPSSAAEVKKEDFVPPPRRELPFQHKKAAANEAPVDNEYRHFKIYIDQTAIHLAGCHKLDIWTQLVPQVSEADPGIRYAVTAIGALSLSLVRPPNPNEKCQHKAIAYRQYSKSIDIVKNATLRGGTSIERRLLACILYATFEGIHGNAKSMESFVQSGIGMIENYMTSPNPKPIDPIILEVFTVVEIEAGAFIDGGAKLSLNPKYLEQSISHSIPKYYTDLKEARLAVIVIVAKALRWMYDRHHNPSPEPIESELTTHLTRLQTWSAAFAPLLTTSLALPRGSFNLKAAAMIRAHYLAYYLWICTASPTLHTWYRKFTGELWEIVRMIEIICEEGKGEVYAIAVRVVVPLVVVALKFKERGARRRVLELIPRLPRRGAKGVYSLISYI